MSNFSNLINPGRLIRVGVILLKGGIELIDIAPTDLIHEVSHHFVDPLPPTVAPDNIKGQALNTEYHWVSEAGPGTLMKGTSGIVISPTDSFETSPPLDIVVIPASGNLAPSPAEIEFLWKSYNESSAFLAICFGMLGPLEAGILEGKTATAPRFALDGFRNTAPGTNWVDKRWVRDGKLWTSGALLNGMDLVSAFIRETWPSGEGTLMHAISKMGGWPDRGPDYTDAEK